MGLAHHYSAINYDCGKTTAASIGLVPLEGLEPPLLSEADFESAASTIPPQGHFGCSLKPRALRRQPERRFKSPNDQDFRFVLN
jgi:hypothetical protein